MARVAQMSAQVRDPGPDNVSPWEARRFIRPYQDRLEIWTAETAQLAATRSGDRDQHFDLKVNALLQLLAATQKELDVDLKTASPELARHSLVRDIKRALGRLSEALSSELGQARNIL